MYLFSVMIGQIFLFLKHLLLGGFYCLCSISTFSLYVAEKDMRKNWLQMKISFKITLAPYITQQHVCLYIVHSPPPQKVFPGLLHKHTHTHILKLLLVLLIWQNK